MGDRKGRHCHDNDHAVGGLDEVDLAGARGAAKGFAAGMERAAVLAESAHGVFGRQIAGAIRSAAAAAVPAPGHSLAVTPAGLAALKRTRR